jgi:hypothetical protein
MSHPDKIGVLNAMDDPAHRQLLEEMIGRMRGAIAPMLNGATDAEHFGLVQSMMVSAGAMLAGLTVGHMVALGKMKPHDRARATKVVTVAFRSAIKLGEREAREAMLEQMPVQGSS